MPPVSRRGDLQRLADRLDPELVSVLIDELSHVLKRRSSSAWAKNALAKRRISLALRNSRTSRSSALTRSCSAVLGPSRWPVSRSCWRTHRRSVSAVQPIFAAIDTIAAHCDAYSSLDSATIRTARSMTSGENFDDLFMMAPFSQMMEPPSNPGRFSTVTPRSYPLVRIANASSSSRFSSYASSSLERNGAACLSSCTAYEKLTNHLPACREMTI